MVQSIKSAASNQVQWLSAIRFTPVSGRTTKYPAYLAEGALPGYNRVIWTGLLLIKV